PSVLVASVNAAESCPSHSRAWTDRLLPHAADRLDAGRARCALGDPTRRAAGRPRGGAAVPRWRRPLCVTGAGTAARTRSRPVRQEPGLRGSDASRVAALSRPPLRASREADPRAPGVMSRKKRKLTVRVPNPRAPVKE